eukprot:7922774-Lingulodinium_polyedra.AAC.1
MRSRIASTIVRPRATLATSARTRTGQTYATLRRRTPCARQPGAQRSTFLLRRRTLLRRKTLPNRPRIPRNA